MEVIENLNRFAKLMARLNKEGLDTELIQMGIGQLGKMSDDETIQLENDVEQIKDQISKHKSELKDDSSKLTGTSMTEKKIVRGYIDGCYDLIHAGHYNSLRQASKLGDRLVLGINSDSEIEKVKGPTIFKCEERCEVVRACKWVDEVVPDTEYTPTEGILDRYNCDFYAHGDDVAVNESGEDSASQLKKVGRFKMFKRTKGVSTTDIAAKLLRIHDENVAKEEVKNLDSSAKSKKTSLPAVLGSHNANPDFMASAKRIALFANIREPSDTDRIIYVDGAFDVLHPGHIELLKNAKALGDFLIVGLHEDQAVNQYMGEHYPLNALHERVLNVLACKYVDDVIIGAPFKITNKLIKDLNVSVVVKSWEYITNSMIEEARLMNPYEVSFRI